MDMSVRLADFYKMAQRATIAEYADEVISAKPLSDRPGALAAIAAVEAG